MKKFFYRLWYNLQEMTPIILMISYILAWVFAMGYFCLFGGIVSLINGVQVAPNSARLIAWGIVRIVAVIPVFWIGLFSILFIIKSWADSP